MAKREFLKEFLKKDNKVGSITPSSRFLIKKLLSNVDFKNAKLIVELGPGTGIFTREILKQMGDDCILISFELNPLFCDKLKISIKDKRFILVHDSAENISEYLKTNNHPQPDAIVSTLPFSILPNTVKDNILSEIHENLKDDGIYLQIQYSLGLKKKLKSEFERVEVDFTPLNIPPSFIYKCYKNKEA